MKLRAWQSGCIQLALKKYLGGQKHFLALATPGAGKTTMASELANKMLTDKRIDLVICFSPSSIVANDFCESLESITNESFDGLLGARGRSLTYQNLQYLDNTFWQLFTRFRVFVICDEIHHCAGSNIDNANAWGEQILRNIQEKAAFTLALTGTPWRSDAAPIVLSNYIHPNFKISCDYIYGLAEAIKDNVCRVPQVVAVDNDNISVIDDSETKIFTSFRSLLSQSVIPYQDVIQNNEVIHYLVRSSHEKLIKIRRINPDAAGLIVASSVEHARAIARLMKDSFNENVSVVTYRENEPTHIIQQFRAASTPWIISVGMISEGTNIPRLQVCCHLTHIKTEMHFRQILGRILRMTGSQNQEAVMYMPAEPKLLEYAYRVKQEVPFEADIVKFETMKAREEGEKKVVSDVHFDQTTAVDGKTKFTLAGLGDAFDENEIIDFDKPEPEPIEEHFLTTSYEKVVNIFGRFKQESIALGLSELGEFR